MALDSDFATARARAQRLVALAQSATGMQSDAATAAPPGRPPADRGVLDPALSWSAAEERRNRALIAARR